MSVSHLVAVFDMDEPVGATRVVLLVLAEHANAQTGECWPSLPRIARRAGIHEVTARKAITELEAAGLIGVRRRPGRVNRYVLLIDPVTTTTPVDDVPVQGASSSTPLTPGSGYPAAETPGIGRRPRVSGSPTPSVRLGDPESQTPRTVKNRNEEKNARESIADVRARLRVTSA